MGGSNSSGGRRFLAARLESREQSHRRAVLLGIAGLMVLSTSPVFGHHIAPRADDLLGGRQHVLDFCVVALHLLLAPVHTAFHLLLAGGLLYASWDRIRAWYRLRIVLGSVESTVPAAGDAVYLAAEAAGISPTRVRVVAGLPVPAFAAGWMHPKVYVAANITTVLDQEQLTAVLAHEAAHVARRDPLRLSLLRFLGYTLFYIPALRRLAADMADEAEIAADDVAAAGRPLVLASAILALAECGDGFSTSVDVVGFQRVDLLDRRIRRLAGEDTPVTSHVTRSSMVAAAAALVAVWVSGIIVAHPLPGEGAPGTHAGIVAEVRHCLDHHGSAFGHLFCRGAASFDSTKPCPHVRG